jgi:hypothetical protein
MLVATTKKNATVIEIDEGNIGFVPPLIDKHLPSVVFKSGLYDTDTELSLQINKYP